MSAPSMREELAALALGALDAPTRDAVERAVAESPELQDELRQFAEVTALLALGVPTRTPPAALRDRIVAEASQARPITSASPAAQAQAQARVKRRFFRPILSLAPWIVAAASLVGALVTRQTADSERTARALAEQQAEGLAVQLATLDSLVATLTASELSTVALTSTGAPPSARLYWNRARGEVVLAAYRLPPAPAGRIYQLWGIAQGKAPVSLGTFASAGEGRAVVRFTMPAGLQLAVGAVTEEPAGGSLQPTTTPFLAGTLRASE